MAGARAQPVVLTLEDLHWADPTTLDVLRGIAERGALAPLFVLLTARPEFRPLTARFRRSTAIRFGIWWRSFPPAMRWRKAVIEGVTERTGGVPLFVEEVTRLLLERGEQSYLWRLVAFGSCISGERVSVSVVPTCWWPTV